MHHTARPPADASPSPFQDDDPGRDQADPRGQMAALERAAKQLGISPPTRTRSRAGIPLGALSRSTRDGYRPAARAHVERYLLRAVFGTPVPTLCRALGMSRSAVYESIAHGERLVRENARRLGLKPPRRPRDDDGGEGDD